MSEPAPNPSLPWVTRLWFAWVCLFRVLFDGSFALRAWNVREPLALPSAPVPRGLTTSASPSPTPALQLLSLFQREGRLVDFLEQELTGIQDGEIGAVARVVHQGCRKVLHQHASIEPVRAEHEGTRITLEAGFNPAEVKLSGDVKGAAPYQGVLRHRGWRARDLHLPVLLEGHDAQVIAAAEVEL